MISPSRLSSIPTLKSALILTMVVALGAPPAAVGAQELKICEAPVGTLAVVEPEASTLKSLRGFGLQSPTPVLRQMVQESGCFIVVERGAALQQLAMEREMARSGELTGDANVGTGQMQVADFYLTPNVLFSDANAGGVGGAIGGLLGRRAGAIAGGLKFKEAQTSILISATRSGVQVAAAQGEARKTDFALGALTALGGFAGAAAGGYSSTDEGKVIMASFLDNYNKIVQDVRGNPSLPPLTPEEVRARVTGKVQAGGGFAEGDVVAPKMDNIEIFDVPAADAGIVTRVTRSDALVYLGVEEEGFLQVQSPEGAGWVRKVLVTKQP